MEILNNRVPNRWQPSGKPLASHVKDFCVCFEWFSDWWRANQPPLTYWLGAFFHTRALLIAVKLNYAREQHVSIDTVTFDFRVTEDHK